jgi:Tfp pilus assembly protein PilW
MTLGMVILVAALQWYHVLKISNFSEKNKKQILDISRVPFQFIRHDLQSSGYRGCRTQDHNFPIRRNFEALGVPYKFLKTDRAVFGFKAAVGECQQYIPHKFCDHIKQGTDVLVIYNVPQKINVLQRSMANPDDAICIQTGGTIQKNAMALISDTQQGDFFIANDVKSEIIFHQAGENSIAVFSKCYQQDAEVTELQTVAYYLGVPEHRVTARLGTYSLFRSDIRQKSEEIVEGVVDFSVEYGFILPSDSAMDGASEEFQYYAAAEVKPEQWAWVRMVRLTIETKGEVYRGIPQKNHRWEYAFAIRNGHRVNPGIGVAFGHFTHLDS